MNRPKSMPNLLEEPRSSGGGICGSAKAGKKTPVRSKANYGRLRARFAALTPESLQCRLYCGGPLKCKYCSPSYAWPKFCQAIPGLYSHWVTPRILAMARPTQTAVEHKFLPQVLKENGVRSIINLQKGGEHEECSPNPLINGFAYDSKSFMDVGISHYNFGWGDFGTGPVSGLLDMVKVLEMCVGEGAVAVHCHAGLGRTGVLVAAFLVASRGLSPDHAIALLRHKRPASVQTPGQVRSVYSFAAALSRLRRVFPLERVSLAEALAQQASVLRGLEARLLHHVPKLLFVVGERLWELAGLSHEGRLRKRLHNLHEGHEKLYDQLLRHTRGAPEQRLDAKPPPMRKTSAMVSVLSAPPGSSSRPPSGKLPPIGRAGVLVSSPVPSAPASRLDWGGAVRSCLADLKVPDAQDSVFGDVGSYRRRLRFAEESWEELAKETSGECLLLLLQSWFLALSGPVLVETAALPQIIAAEEAAPSLDVPTGAKWTMAHACRVFAPLCHGRADHLYDTAKLLASWLCRTDNDEIVTYLLSYLNKFALEEEKT